jgi:CcmD family protein
MRAWGFVAAAYGIVWGVISLYFYSLKRRYNEAAAELERLRSQASPGYEKE